MTLTRRRFLGLTAAGCAGGMVLGSANSWIALADVTSTSSATDSLVVIILRGGLDGLSVLAPIGDGGTYYDPRPTIAIAESDALPLTTTFGLHPALAPLLDSIRSGRVAFVPAAGVANESRSHFEQQDLLDRGVIDAPAATGWVARLVGGMTPTGPMRTAAMSSFLPEVVEGAPAIVAMDSLRATIAAAQQTGDLATGGALLRRLGGDGPIGSATANTIDAMTALSRLSDARDARSSTYPTSRLGLQLLDVSTLLAAGVGVDAAVIEVGGWDMHTAMGTARAGALHDQLAMLASALAAFDADTAGLSRPVTTVVLSEFGRRVEENDGGGTDHGRGGLVMAVGDGISGGVHGDWPGLAPGVLDNGDVPVVTDYRDVLAELVQTRLGAVDLGTVFPDLAPRFVGVARG